ncbi:hypothetical protein NPIL_190421 [Nephila pilipes]|uniref:Uncharacterized protein n=1 Tax=Nephila pilipes TaxID=299642 RepID=A0A8X6MSP8_NEPPI|nr:hypothetical protein NPIL_190421 [Nephila pilipes]
MSLSNASGHSVTSFVAPNARAGAGVLDILRLCTVAGTLTVIFLEPDAHYSLSLKPLVAAGKMGTVAAEAALVFWHSAATAAMRMAWRRWQCCASRCSLVAFWCAVLRQRFGFKMVCVFRKR